MNTKKILFGICTCLILMIAACTTNTADDQVYENGLDKSKVPSQALDKSKVPSQAN